MSEFVLSAETWYGIGVAVVGGVVTWLGLRHGGQRRDEASGQVMGLALGGQTFAMGQSALTSQALGDITKVGRELVGAMREQAKATRELTGAVRHFDETTEREAREQTHEKLDELHEEIRNLKRPHDGG